MNKLLIGATASIGTSVVGASTVVLASSSSSQKPVEPSDIAQTSSPSEEVSEPQVPKIELRKSILEGLAKSEDIKAVYSKIDCLKNQFPVVEWNKNTSYTDESTSFKKYGNSDNDISVLSTGNLKGCLIVEYDKTTFKNKKWSGDFKAIWAVSNGDKGFILVTTTQMLQGKKSIGVDGSIYFLNKKQGSRQTWETKSYGIVEGLEVDSNKLSNFLVQPGSAINDLKSKDYWGFDPKLDELCQGQECADSVEKTSYLSAIWEFEEGTDYQITDWSSNFKEWTQSLFPGFLKKDSSTITQKGKWVKKTLSKE